MTTRRTLLLIALPGLVRSPLEQLIWSKQDTEAAQSCAICETKAMFFCLTISYCSIVHTVTDVSGLWSACSVTPESIPWLTFDSTVHQQWWTDDTWYIDYIKNTADQSDGSACSILSKLVNLMFVYFFACLCTIMCEHLCIEQIFIIIHLSSWY